jgi:hypothetical protein
MVKTHKIKMSERQMHRSVFLSIPLLCLVTLSINCPFVPWADAQTCGGEGVAVQVLRSGGPELQDKRASSSYLVWQDGQARVLVDVGGGSALRLLPRTIKLLFPRSPTANSNNLTPEQKDSRTEGTVATEDVFSGSGKSALFKAVHEKRIYRVNLRTTTTKPLPTLSAPTFECIHPSIPAYSQIPLLTIVNYRTCRILRRGISSPTDNITIRDHRALRASFSLPSFLSIAYGLRLNSEI